MNIEELQAKLPVELQAWAVQYGPVFLSMSTDEVKAWIDLIIAGDIQDAYSQVLRKLPNADLLNEWGKINQKWNEANIKNKASTDLSKQALMGLMKILLTIGLAAVGL